MAIKHTTIYSNLLLKSHLDITKSSIQKAKIKTKKEK